MSGIYIKGIEMPKNCEECAIKSWDMEDYVCPFSGISTLCISRQANCPLISVPDHGRLIDADALMSKFAEKVRRSNNSDFAPIPRWNHAVAIVEEMPTIIPADKKYFNEKPKTNADRIRAMTDEELVFFFWGTVDGSGKTVEQWRKWLKQEAE